MVIGFVNLVLDDVHSLGAASPTVFVVEIQANSLCINYSSVKSSLIADKTLFLSAYGAAAIEVCLHVVF